MTDRCDLQVFYEAVRFGALIIHKSNGVPGLDEMGNRKQSAEHNADASNRHIRNPKKGILPSHYRSSRDHQRFCASIFRDREI